MAKFSKKNIVVNGVKSFGKIEEDTNGVMITGQRSGDLVVNIDQSKISGVVFAKAILIIMKNMKVREKIIEPIIDEAFKYLGKTWKERNRAIVGEDVGVIFLKNRDDFRNLESRREDTIRKTQIEDMGKWSGDNRNDMLDDGRTNVIIARALAILKLLYNVKDLFFARRVKKD